VKDKSKRDGKFTPLSQEGVLLRYDGYSKNYRVLIDSEVTVHSREYVKFEEKLADGFHSDLPPLVDVTDDEEDALEDSEFTSDSLDVHEDGHVDLPIENVAENVPDVSLAPLGSEFTIPLPLLDNFTFRNGKGFGI
jgi:hypothetical protein